MKLLYTHPNSLIVLNAKNIIENNGYTVFLRNQYSAGAIGELPPTNNWLEIWLFQEIHFERASALLDSFIPSKSDSTELKFKNEADWFCAKCDEKNGSAFEYCWNCETFK